MVVSEIRLYELLKAKLGTAEAEAFVSLLDSKVDTKFESKKDAFATKEDLHSLEQRMNNRLVDLQKSIYLTSIGNYIAIVGSVLAILMFMRNFG